MTEKKYGYIYKISNDLNNKVYIGQTKHTIEYRFNQHCRDKRHSSSLHNAMRKYGVEHFSVEQIEYAPLEKLNDLEEYWVRYYDSYRNGYNDTPNGKGRDGVGKIRHYKQIIVKGTDIVFESLDEMSQIFKKVVGWEYSKTVIRKCIENNTDFCGFRLIREKRYEEEVSSFDEAKKWILSLDIPYGRQLIYCKEFDMKFDSMNALSKYLYENNYINGSSNQTALMRIKKSVCYNDYFFVELDNGETISLIMCEKKKVKSTNGSFIKKPIRCNELNIEFDSGMDAAKYMIDNNYWNGIKFKTAKLAISAIVTGNKKSYKGYTFSYIE